MAWLWLILKRPNCLLDIGVGYIYKTNVWSVKVYRLGCCVLAEQLGIFKVESEKFSTKVTCKLLKRPNSIYFKVVYSY